MTRPYHASGAVLALCIASTPIAADDCSADFDGDGSIGGADLTTLLADWGECERPCASDLDANGVVDGADITRLLADWGACSTPCPDLEPFTYVVIPDTQYMTSYSTGL